MQKRFPVFVLITALFFSIFPLRVDAFSLSSLIERHQDRMQKQYESISRQLCSVVSILLPFAREDDWCIGRSNTVVSSESAEKQPATQAENISEILIYEVYPVVDRERGEDPTNEWVTLYNNTSTTTDLSDWILENTTASSTLPSGTTLVPGHSLFVVASSTTVTFWSIGASITATVLQSERIGGGFDVNDVLYLKKPDGLIVDAVNWGSNTSVFGTTTPIIPEGGSLVRASTTVDTDTADDWIATSTPTLSR